MVLVLVLTGCSGLSVSILEPVEINVERLEGMEPMQCILHGGQNDIHMHFYKYDQTPVIALVFIWVGSVVLQYCYLDQGELVNYVLDIELYMNTQRKVYIRVPPKLTRKSTAHWLTEMLERMEEGCRTPFIGPPKPDASDRFRRDNNALFQIFPFSKKEGAKRC